MAAKSTPKDVALSEWRNLPPGQNPLPLMRPIPYKSAGSKYGCDGIRIDGSPAFVDSVLSLLKSLIDGENGITRLELSRRQVVPVTIKGDHKGFVNAVPDAEVCYIRLHERGREAQMCNAIFGSAETQGATRRYAKAHGIDEAPEGLFG